MAKKKKSKFKKILKKLGKVAALGGAAYGAAKLFGGPKKHWANIGPSVDSGRGSETHGAQLRASNILNDKLGIGHRTDPILQGGVGTKLAPEGRSWRSYWPFKKGGKVGVGIAKRGYGRALGRGKK